jgi:DNA-binding transcriptional MerR regulator
METKEFYTVKETMELLGVKKRTIYHYRSKGILKCHKPAGFLYITHKSIQDFLKRRTQKN